MSAHLYRAVALDELYDEWSGDLLLWVGAPIGRTTGYLSRSSAVEAGKNSGVRFTIVRSEPVVFPEPNELVAQAQEIADLKAKLLAAGWPNLWAVSA